MYTLLSLSLCSLPRLVCQNSGGWFALGRVLSFDIVLVLCLVVHLVHSRVHASIIRPGAILAYPVLKHWSLFLCVDNSIVSILELVFAFHLKMVPCWQLQWARLASSLVVYYSITLLLYSTLLYSTQLYSTQLNSTQLPPSLHSLPEEKDLHLCNLLHKFVLVL